MRCHHGVDEDRNVLDRMPCGTSSAGISRIAFLPFLLLRQAVFGAATKDQRGRNEEEEDLQRLTMHMKEGRSEIILDRF